MFKILIVGFGSIGYRYFEAINKISLPVIKLFIVDKKIKSLTKNLDFNIKSIKTFENLKNLPKKVNLCIISTTCQNRHILLKKIINETDCENLILEKPLTQSPNELLKLNIVLKNMKNIWVNTDRRSLDIYKFVKSKICFKNKILMRVQGNNWGICCNSLHFVDLFNFLTNKYLFKIEEKSTFTWFPAKRKGFKELDNGKLKLKFGNHELYLSSKKNSLPKNLEILIKNKDNTFYIKEKSDLFELKYNKKVVYFKNNPTSIKMTKIIKKILLKGKSDLPNYLIVTKLYHPLIDFFLKKWVTFFPKSRKVPIT